MGISRSALTGILLINCPIILRIVFGPFHKTLVIIVCYLHQVVISFCINTLTFKTFLASAFVLDFDKMSGGWPKSINILFLPGFNDTSVVIAVFLVSTAYTMVLFISNLLVNVLQVGGLYPLQQWLMGTIHLNLLLHLQYCLRIFQK